jgi:hypothetical protein
MLPPSFSLSRLAQSATNHIWNKRGGIGDKNNNNKQHQGRVPGREVRWVVGLAVTSRRPLFFLFDLPHDSCFKHGNTIFILPSRPLKKSSNIGITSSSSLITSIIFNGVSNNSDKKPAAS